MSIPFQEPISFHIPNLGKKRFSSASAIVKWARTESEVLEPVWREIEAAAATESNNVRASLNSLRQIPKNICSVAEQIEQSSAATPAQLDSLKVYFRLYENHRMLSSETPEGRAAISAVGKKQPWLGGIPLIYTANIDLQTRHSTSKDFVLTSLAAAHLTVAVRSTGEITESLTALRSKYSDSLADLEARQEQLRDEQKKEQEIHKGKLNDTVEIARKSLEDWDAKCSAMRQNQQDRFDSLAEVFKEKLRLEEPSKYWKDKESRHQERAKTAFWSFIVVAAIGAVAIALAGPDLLRQLRAPDGTIGFGAVAILTLPTLIFLWMLRLVSRIFVTNLQRAEDAAEREVFTSTFLALIYEDKGGMREAERLIVLQALFRPGPGDSAEETPASGLADLMKGWQSPT